MSKRPAADDISPDAKRQRDSVEADIQTKPIPELKDWVERAAATQIKAFDAVFMLEDDPVGFRKEMLAVIRQSNKDLLQAFHDSKS